MVISPTVASSPTKDGSDLPEQPTHILIAEDDEILAKGLGHNLRQLGYQVIGPALDGEKAIALAKQVRPDLAILDIRMPNIDGLGAAAMLFKQMGVPVILASAHSDPEYVVAGKQIGVFGYLVKPVTIDQIRVNIAVVWAKYRQHASLQNQVEDLKIALEDRKFIERAKGLLMDKLGLGENEAMCQLKKQARDSRRRLSDLARMLIETEQLFDRKPNTSYRKLSSIE